MSIHSKSSSRVIFHADDFGMNEAVNQGILQSFREGLLTSTSLLANAPGAESACRDWNLLAADYTAGALKSLEARQRLNDPPLPFDLGIHLNLTQGRPLTCDRYPTELLDSRGHFPGIGALFVRLQRSNASMLQSVGDELRSQIEWMLDHGLRPTHLNGHQYIELIPQISSQVPELLNRYGIKVVRVAREPALVRNVLLQGRPLTFALGLVKQYFAATFARSLRRLNVQFPGRFYGTSHAGRVDFQTVEKFLQNPPENDCAEIGLHPSVKAAAETENSEDPWFDPLQSSRWIETDWLCGDQLPRLLESRQIGLGRLQKLTIN